jgi:hypothetical protein
MEFKLFYCDDNDLLNSALNSFSEDGYEKCDFDRAHCVSMDFIPNKQRYWASKLVFKGAGNGIIYETLTSFWRNFVLFFDDGTSIVLRRDFGVSIKSNSVENIDLINDFVNRVHRKLNGPAFKLAHDEVEFMDI